jgi:hypothetical protein
MSVRRPTAVHPATGALRRSPASPGAPSPHWGGNWDCDEGLPGADIKNTGDDARLRHKRCAVRWVNPPDRVNVFRSAQAAI